jgi:hypothetical protein
MLHYLKQFQTSVLSRFLCLIESHIHKVKRVLLCYQWNECNVLSV